MDNIQKMKQEKRYQGCVKKKTPRHNVWLNMLKAFLLGGLICLIGQAITHYCETQGLGSERQSPAWTSLALVFFKRGSHGNRHLSAPGEMGRRRSARSDHRIRQFGGGAFHRI